MNSKEYSALVVAVSFAVMLVVVFGFAIYKFACFCLHAR